MRPTRRGDDGLSVMEFVVAAALALVVVTSAVGVFAATVRSMRLVSVRTANIADARIAMEEMTREVRVAMRPNGKPAALVSATSTSLSFYALLNRSSAAPTNTDTAPTRLDYSYDGTCVQLTTTAMVKTAGTWNESGPSTTKCLLRTTSGPQFSYFTTGAIAVAGIDVDPLTVPVAGLTAAVLPSVQSIEITLTGQDATMASVPGSHLRSRVTLTNVLDLAGG